MQEPSPYLLRAGLPPPANNAGGPDFRLFAHQEQANLLVECWRVIRARLFLIIGVAAAVLAFTGLWVFNAVRVYTASSTVLIEPSAPRILNDKTVVTEGVADYDELHDYYKTQYDILKSRTLATQVIRDLGLETNPAFAGSGRPPSLVSALRAAIRSRLRVFLRSGRGGASGAGLESARRARPPADQTMATLGIKASIVNAYLGGLTVEPKVGTRLTVVMYTSPDPQLSAQIVNAHVRAYIRRGMELHAAAGKDAREFLENKLVDLKERVEKSEAALNAYRRDRGIVAFTPHDKGRMIMQQLTDLNSGFTRAETERISLEAQHQEIRKGDYEALPEIINSPLIQGLKRQIAALAADYASLSNRFNPGYHRLDDLKAKLMEARARLRKEIRALVESVEAKYRADLAKQQKLQAQIDRVKAQALALNDASVQDAVLTRDVEMNQKLYESVLQRIQEIAVVSNGPDSNVSVVDEAEPPLSPSSPRVGLSLALSGVVGLSGGVGLAFLLDYMDDRLKSKEEVENYFRLPSLGFVPDFTKAASKGYFPKGYVSHRPATAGSVSEADPGSSKEMIISGSRLSAAAEIYRTIRTALLFSRAGSPPKAILITSATGSEGKTVTAVNIALAFAQMGARTLLVDADLRRSRCHEVLAIENHLGLTEVLVGQKEIRDVIHSTKASGLFLLSAGSVPPNPGELLVSSRMRELLGELGQDFEFIVIDSAPLIPVSDTLGLATMADGVLMIAGGQSPKRLVREACSRLNVVGARIFGVVVNRVNASSPGYYHYGYHYGYDSYRDESRQADAG